MDMLIKLLQDMGRLWSKYGIMYANGITTFVDIRPISSGNGYLLRMEEDGELYADYIINGQKRHRKIMTQPAEFIDAEGKMLLACLQKLAYEDENGQSYYEEVYDALNNMGE